MSTFSKRWSVAAGEEGRLDRFLASKYDDVSRAYLQAIIGDGSVSVNGRVAEKSTDLKIGDEILVHPFVHPKDRRIQPNPKIDLNIVWKSSDLIVIDKPAGLPTHPNDFEDTDTVANALISLLPETAEVGEDPLRPGIVHRLDGDTSGLLILALTQEAFLHMRKQFDERKVKKTYFACVLGKI